MSLPAISVRNLGKMYRLAHQGKRTDSFREAITSTVLAPFRRISQLRGTDETQEEFWALKDVSFDVQPGEVVGIIGRNGAGKSTLLKILSRIVEPTEGEIRLRGRVASLLEVGTGFHPELTGRENIYLNGSILGMKRREIDKKFDEIVDFAEVEKFLDTPVKRYSSGMYVRLAFAVAAHLDPEILIVDEVLAVGDAEFQKKCLGKMKEVATGTGRTVLFVSHNMAAIRSMCNSCVLLRHGVLDDVGPTSRVLQKYHGSGKVDKNCFIGSAIGPFREVKINVGNLDGSPVFELEDLIVEMSFESSRKILRLGLELRIELLDGSPIAHIDSYPGLEKIEIRDSESIAINIRLHQLPLRPGRYALYWGLRDDANFAGWKVPEAIVISVVEHPDPRLACRRDSVYGNTAVRYSIDIRHDRNGES